MTIMTTFTLRCLRPHLAWIAALGTLVTGFCAGIAHAQWGSTPGARRPSFATRAEAEEVAPQFRCEGAHRVGDQWYPCPAPKPRMVTGSPDAPIGQ